MNLCKRIVGDWVKGYTKIKEGPRVWSQEIISVGVWKTVLVFLELLLANFLLKIQQSKHKSKTYDIEKNQMKKIYYKILEYRMPDSH